MLTFKELGISENIIKAIAKMGFEEATPIQNETIPITIKGRDIIGQAQTGTGKTAAFGIPLIQKMKTEHRAIQGLVVTPTRELAIQVAEEINKIGQYEGVRALPIYGGQDISHQIRALKSWPQIIVGTPGRLMDHMRRKTIRLRQVSMVILDEADEMLNMGFIDDIKAILNEVPSERQTLLFSATMPRPIRDLSEQFMDNPAYISIKKKEVTAPDTEQLYVEVQDKQKFDILCRFIDIQTPKLSIVFCRTKKRVDEVSEALAIRGYFAEGIHGDLSQSKRDTVIRHFREGNTEILVATDVAARGLDISNVTHVFNFDVPQDPESYVHRIGRTGRAGRSGLAITFVTPREIGQLKQIEQIIKRRIDRKPIPTFTEAIEGKQRVTIEKLMGEVDAEGVLHYRELAQELLEKNDSVTLLSAALKLLTKDTDTAPVNISDHAPLRMKKIHDKPMYERQGRRKGYNNPSKRRGKGSYQSAQNTYYN